MRSVPGAGRRLLLALLAVIAGVSGGSGQGRRLPFEKQGAFIAPDGGLSLSRRHQDVHAIPSSTAFDVLSYRLDLSLAMVNEESLRP